MGLGVIGIRSLFTQETLDMEEDRGGIVSDMVSLFGGKLELK